MEPHIDQSHKERHKKLIQELGEIAMVSQEALDEMKKKVDLISNE